MTFIDCREKDWLPKCLTAVKTDGFTIVTRVLDNDFIAQTKENMYGVQKSIHGTLGIDKLNHAGELGVLRLMMKYDAWFFKFLEIPQLLDVIDNVLSKTAIMHLQNGFILPSATKNIQKTAPKVFQNSFHRDLKKILGGSVCSINMMFAIDEFTVDNGATLCVPGTHQKEPPPPEAESRARQVAAVCPAGSMVVFDSTLWHAAGANTSGSPRLAINHQFTHSFFKQQLDYPRALNLEKLNLKERTKQLLGWYTRVPTSLEEYYVPPDERLYRGGQW